MTEISPKRDGLETALSIVVPIREIQAWLKSIAGNIDISRQSGFAIEILFVYTKGGIDSSIHELEKMIGCIEGGLVETRIVATCEPGIYAAMNAGIAMAKGSYLLFLGADDRLLPGFLNAMQALQQLHPSPCVLADALLPDDTEQTLQTIRASGGRAGQVHWLLGMPRIHQAIFYQRSYLINHHLHYTTNLRVCSDYLLTCEILLRTQGSCRSIDQCIVAYNNTGFSSRFSSSQLYCEHVKGFWQSKNLRVYTPLIIATRILLLAFKAFEPKSTRKRQ